MHQQHFEALAGAIARGSAEAEAQFGADVREPIALVINRLVAEIEQIQPRFHPGLFLEMAGFAGEVAALTPAGPDREVGQRIEFDKVRAGDWLEWETGDRVYPTMAGRVDKTTDRVVYAAAYLPKYDEMLPPQRLLLKAWGRLRPRLTLDPRINVAPGGWLAAAEAAAK